MGWSKSFLEKLNRYMPKAVLTVLEDETLSINLDNVGIDARAFADGWFASIGYPASTVTSHCIVNSELFPVALAAAKKNGFTLLPTDTPNRYQIVESDDTLLMEDGND